MIVLDEFDEIHEEMYRYGPLAEAFFSNIRTLSSKDNLAFILIGGENMPFIMNAQGDQLNKFGYEPLTYFSRDKEWDDYVDLVRNPVEGVMTWYSEAIRYLFDVTKGHPYYTKIICSDVYSTAVDERDSDIVEADVEYSVKRLIQDLDVNSFSHFWKDGIQSGDDQEKEMVSVRRCKFLIAVSDVINSGMELSREAALDASTGLGLNRDEAQIVLDDFMRREIIINDNECLEFAVPFFRQWLTDEGFKKIIPDILTDQFIAKSGERENELRVTAHEIVTLARRMPVYRGRKITEHEIRAWIEQVSSIEDQRILFKILSNTHVVSSELLSDSLRQSHAFAESQFPAKVTRRRGEKRKDVAIVYVDGEGKSGQLVARRYAEENRLMSRCISNGKTFSGWVSSAERELDVTFNGLVIIDDVVATGASLSQNLDVFFEENYDVLKERNMHVVVSAMYSTKSGAQKVEKTLAKYGDVSAFYYICNHINDSLVAFPENSLGIWGDQQELEKAKALVSRIGGRIYKKRPLGWGDLGLLLVFPDNCPNNSLPILHSEESGSEGWQPIFKRIIH